MAQSPGFQQRLAELTRQARKPLRRPSAGSSAVTRRPSLADRSAKLRHLSETQVFASLPPAERTWLLENTTMITCERGRVFYTPDQPGEVVFILKRGKVDLYRISPEGRKLVVATLEP